MKKLLFITLIALSIGAEAQSHMYDSIVKTSPDTLLVGDILHLTIYCEVASGAGQNSDSVYLLSTNTYLHNFLDAYNNAHWDATYSYDTVTLQFNVVIPVSNAYTDSTYTKVLLELHHSGDNSDWVNTPRKYIYIKDTVTHPLGINTISAINYSAIREVRYYTITGQLYGTYPQKQNQLPHVPLIEEVIYTNNEFSSRELLHL